MYLKLLFISFMLMGGINASVLAATHAAAGAGAGVLEAERPQARVVSAGTNPIASYHYKLYGLDTAVTDFKLRLNQIERSCLGEGTGAPSYPTVAVLRTFLREWLRLYGLGSDDHTPTGSGSRMEAQYTRINHLDNKDILALEEAQQARPVAPRGVHLRDVLFNASRFPDLENTGIEIAASFSGLGVPQLPQERHPITVFHEDIERWVVDDYNPFALLLYGTMVYDGIGCRRDQTRGIRNIEQAKAKNVIPALEFIGLHLHDQMEEMRASHQNVDAINTVYQDTIVLYQRLSKPERAYRKVIMAREPNKSMGKADKIRDNLLLEIYVVPHRDALLTFYTELESAILKGSESLRPHPKSEEITVSLANSLVSAASGGLQAYNGSAAAALSALGGTIVTGGLGIHRYIRGGEGTLWFVECCRRRCIRSSGIGALDKDVFEDRIHEIALHQTLKFAEDICAMPAERQSSGAKALAKAIVEGVTLFDSKEEFLSAFLIENKKIKDFRWV